MDAWGKFEPPDRWHLLEHHCADVAACFEALIQDRVLRTRFEQASGADGLCETTLSRLTVLAFLHDFGKLNAGFQFRERSARSGETPRKAGHVVEALYAFEQREICEALGLCDLHDDWGGDSVSRLLHAALSHHGRPARKPTRHGTGPPELWRPFETYDPVSIAARLRERSRAWFPEAFRQGPPLPARPAFVHLFAGIVALADQIGSNDCFRYESAPDPRYIDRARRTAAEIVKNMGFRRADHALRAGAADFAALFEHAQPRPLQSAVADAPLDRRLLILESETGSGKTEAAVLRFAALQRAGLVDGLYFAAPTRAAAKQLHERVQAAIERMFPGEPKVPTILAIPGYLRADDVCGQRLARFEVIWEDEPDEEERLARWSAESARLFLSATAAVGTIDQALLAGLKVKWAHLRGACLSRSLLVVDEVHASDAYMTALLCAVLQAHLSLGGHALLMSATLGSAARTKLLEERARTRCPEPDDAESAPYPALTLAAGSGGGHEAQPISGVETDKTVSMRVESILSEPSAIARRALTAARQGAKALVIRNTVATAQEVFDALVGMGGSSMAMQVEGAPTLHHSRFAAEDRALLDDAVEHALGKGRTLGGLVVIGTQTLEQSLDIDADLLLSDLCPADVLLQRIGRLHRRPGNLRPDGFREPCCIVLTPENGLETGVNGGLLRHGLGVSEHGGVYRDLLGCKATQDLIVAHPIWTIPRMNRMLVERATHPQALTDLAQNLGGAWVEHEQKTFGLASAEARLAQEHAFTRTEAFDELAFPDLDEKVRTRLGDDGPRIVLSEPAVGPFGAPVETFNLPAHLFRGKLPGKKEIDSAQAEPVQDGLILHVGDHRLSYDRAGVRLSA